MGHSIKGAIDYLGQAGILVKGAYLAREENLHLRENAIKKSGLNPLAAKVLRWRGQLITGPLQAIILLLNNYNTGRPGRRDLTLLT
jgi:hypothetical protein